MVDVPALILVELACEPWGVAGSAVPKRRPLAGGRSAVVIGGQDVPAEREQAPVAAAAPIVTATRGVKKELRMVPWEEDNYSVDTVKRGGGVSAPHVVVVTDIRAWADSEFREECLIRERAREAHWRKCSGATRADGE